MQNLYEKSSKELREIAKAAKVKKYWLLGKADLITGILANPEFKKQYEEEPEEIRLEPEAPVSTETSAATDKAPKNEPKADKTSVSREKRKFRQQTFEYNGKAQSLRAWANETGMEYNTLYDRINRLGWPLDRALTAPCKVSRKKKEVSA